MTITIPRINQTKTLGLALGGGGAAGFGHIGAISVLEEAGIKVDYLCGTSMGAIIGALYAIGMPSNEMMEFAQEAEKIKISSLRNLNLTNVSLIDPEKIFQIIEKAIGNRTFEDCKIPFGVVAIDIESGTEVLLDKGTMKYALMASSAIPLVFPPVPFGEKILVDGGLLNNVPITHLYKKRVERKVGIAIKNFTSRQHLSGAIFKHYFAGDYKVLKQAKMFKRLQENLNLLADIALRSFEIATSDSTEHRIQKANPDLVVRPEIEIELLSLDKASGAIKLGRKAMEDDFKKLESLLI
ncbi:patatin-like phospholipase family protein [Patescibacteria group bacterium]|nr:patatin-like phospholipase family protein [Patescibacteria group bacterium]